jgi:Flp pilus assembly protein TadB
VIAARDRQRQRIDVLASEPRFPAFVAAALEHGVRSSLSLPLSGRYHPTALNLYSTREAAFATRQAQAAAQLLAGIITAMTTPSDPSALHAPDVTAARRRGARVEAAVEATMRRDSLTEAEAFAVLTQRSRIEGASVHTIADEILGEKGGTP